MASRILIPQLQIKTMLLAVAAAAKSLQSCPTVPYHRQQPTRLPRPWNSPGKNTGVGCHLLLQCIKVNSESEVVRSRPTLSGPMDCSPPGSSVHRIFQARALEWGAIAFSVFSLYHLQLSSKNKRRKEGGKKKKRGGRQGKEI